RLKLLPQRPALPCARGGGPHCHARRTPRGRVRQRTCAAHRRHRRHCRARRGATPRGRDSRPVSRLHRRLESRPRLPRFRFFAIGLLPRRCPPARRPRRRTLRRRRALLRLESGSRRPPSHHCRRRPRCLQRRARHRARSSLGRRFLLPHRVLARQKGPSQNDRFSARGQGGARRMTSQPDAGGHFGPYGGRYVPEVLMAPIEELETAYLAARDDPAFQTELADLLHNYAGRPTPLYFAKHLTETLGGARIWLKREDLLHTGAHKINNCLGQALLARRMGKRRIIAETGAGQHGVATPGAQSLFPRSTSTQHTSPAARTIRPTVRPQTPTKRPPYRPNNTHLRA